MSREFLASSIRGNDELHHGLLGTCCYCTRPRELTLDIKSEILALLDEVLSLKGRASTFTEDTPLLGALPELDSMAVVALITSMEERFGFSVDDDEIDGATFATVGSLIEFVETKQAA